MNSFNLNNNLRHAHSTDARGKTTPWYVFSIYGYVCMRVFGTHVRPCSMAEGQPVGLTMCMYVVLTRAHGPI